MHCSLSKISVHHLDYSRGTRILWLLEEAGIDYKVIRYSRIPGGPAPVALASVHPLGKSPAIEENGFVLAESSAILRYINRTRCDDSYYPYDSKLRAKCDEIIDYIEPSVMPVLIAEITGKQNRATALQEALNVLDTALGDSPYLVGEDLSLADFQAVYALGLASCHGFLNSFPRLQNYFDRLNHRTALITALAQGGPMCNGA